MASEISASPRASPGTSSALCPSHMSLRNVQTDRPLENESPKPPEEKKRGSDGQRSEKGVD